MERFESNHMMAGTLLHTSIFLHICRMRSSCTRGPPDPAHRPQPHTDGARRLRQALRHRGRDGGWPAGIPRGGGEGRAHRLRWHHLQPPRGRPDRLILLAVQTHASPLARPQACDRSRVHIIALAMMDPICMGREPLFSV